LALAVPILVFVPVPISDGNAARSKVGAWQEVARRIAHEIKNPLTRYNSPRTAVHGSRPPGDFSDASPRDSSDESGSGMFRLIEREVSHAARS